MLAVNLSRDKKLAGDEILVQQGDFPINRAYAIWLL